MNKYALAKQKTLVELCSQKDRQIAELKSELGYFLQQYGCECEHPSCQECNDIDKAYALLKEAE